MGCLYQLTSPSGKSYIGITTKTAEERFKKHVERSFSDKPRGALHSAIKKYGAESFEVKTLVIANNWNYLCDLERKAITAFETRYPEGYNLTLGGEGLVGYEHTENDRRTISRAQKLRYSDLEQRQKLIDQSRRANEAMKAAHAARRINGKTPYWHRQEEIAKARKPREREEKISAAVKAAWARPNVREKMRLAAKMRGQEWKDKISKSNIGSKKGPASEERKQKIGIAQKAAWADPEKKRLRLEDRARRFPGIVVICPTCAVDHKIPAWKAIPGRPKDKYCSPECYMKSKRRAH